VASLKSKEEMGEVWFIEFWATWCPPSTNNMQKMEDWLKKNDAKWKNKVQIHAISIDNDLEELMKQIESKDWNRPNNWHIGGDDKIKSDVMEHYHVKGIPHSILIDKKG